MSLNGLDDPKVVEAYEGVTNATEPGAWLLLKYESRDEVVLLDKGTTGPNEMRNAVAGYDEEKPLFGYLKYRRRNVVLKYLPQDCSRLIQARVAVHFNAVCERFSPYDNIFEISKPEELRDSKLSAACSLHATSRSNSTTSSQAKKRMSEIAEEEEEEQRAIKRQSTLDDSDQPATKRQSLHNSKDETAGRPHSPTADPVQLNADLAASPENSKFSAPTTSDLPNFTGIEGRPTSSSAHTVDLGRRLSSQTTRPDLFSYSSYSYGKPKVKLGPRPSLDVGGRPQTAGNFRPVSQIPAGFKLFGKGAKKARGKEDSSTTSSQEAVPEINFGALAAGLPIPEEPIKSQVDAARPATSSGVSTVSTIMPSSATSGKQTISREKARLMKAKKLREQKQKKLTAPAQADQAPADAAVEAIANDGETPMAEETAPAPEPATAAQEIAQTEPLPEKRQSIVKADSGVVINTVSIPTKSPTDQSSEATQSDSRPASPIIASSEPDESTKASSLSESTDETVQEKDADAGEDGKNEDEDVSTDDHKPDTVPEDAVTENNEQAAPAGEASRAVQETAAEPVTEPNSQVDAPAAEPVEAPVESAEAAPVPETKDEEVAEDTTTEMPTHSVEQNENEEEKGEPANDDSEPVPAQEDQVETTNSTAEAADETKTAAGDTVEKQIDVGKEQALPTETNSEEKPAVEAENVSTDGLQNIPDQADQAEQPQATAAQDVTTETVAVPEETTPAEVAPATATATEQPPTESVESTEVNTPAEPLRIPKSKFSTQDLRAARDASLAADVPPVPKPAEEPTSLATQGAAAATEPTAAESPEQTKPKRKTLIEPIKTDLPTHSRQTSRSENNFSDDESLMNELQSATVQEAKPMFVAKTPVSASFPGSPHNQPMPTTPGGSPYVVRTVSNPMRSSMAFPQDVNQSSARSMSSGAAYLHKVTQQQQSGDKLSVKSNMGSRISQRIKALEMLSATSAETASQTSARERPSSKFFSVGRGRDVSRSPSVADRANSFTNRPTSSAIGSRDVSPDAAPHRRRERSGSVASRLSMFESPPGANGGPATSPGGGPRGRPESISVTARIIRDPNQNLKRSDHGHLDLKQSPLLVDHQRSTDTIVQAQPERRSSRDRSEVVDEKGVRRRRSSLSIVKDFIKDGRKSLGSRPVDAPAPQSPSKPPSSHQNNSIASRLSFSSRRSMSYDRENPASPSILSEGSGSGDDSKSLSSEKKRSRAERLMRRLSSLSGSRSKVPNTPSISATVVEEPAGPDTLPTAHASMMARPSTTPTPSIASYLGDVNVQFPDNLLWKRRNMSLDSQGYLILSALQAQNARLTHAHAQGTKKYHLSEFRTPYIPDVEVQELPNSVVLDLIEGSGVQVACEDRTGQMHVLQVLQNAHASHVAKFGL